MFLTIFPSRPMSLTSFGKSVCNRGLKDKVSHRTLVLLILSVCEFSKTYLGKGLLLFILLVGLVSY